MLHPEFRAITLIYVEEYLLVNGHAFGRNWCPCAMFGSLYSDVMGW